jgi:hypothetical protein
VPPHLADSDNYPCHIGDVVSEIETPAAILIKMCEDAPEFFGAYYLFEE